MEFYRNFDYRDSPLKQLPSNRSGKNSHSSIIVKIDGNRWQIIERSDKKWRLRGDDRGEHRSLNTKNPRVRARRARAKAKKNEKPAEDPAYDLERSTSFSAKEILFWDEGRRLVYQGSRGRARAHAYQSSCSRTNQQQQEIKERVNRAWKENRKGGRLLESLRLETSSVFNREPWAVRSERNETRMSLKVFLY